MKHRVDKKALHNALAHVAPIAAGRMPEHSNVHLAARDGHLYLHTVNSVGSEATARVACDGPAEDWALSVPGEYLLALSALIAKGPHDELAIGPTPYVTDALHPADAPALGLLATITDEDHAAHPFTAHILAMRTDAMLHAPDLDADLDRAAFTLNGPAEHLARMLDASHASGNAHYDTRLQGVLVDRTGDTARIVGTDGVRLAIHGGALNIAGERAKARLPGDACVAMQRSLKRQAEDATATLAILPERGDRIAILRVADLRIVWPLADATTYPPYERVLPKPRADATVRVNRDVLRRAVERVMAAHDGATNRRIDVTLDDRAVVLAATGEKVSSVERVPIIGDATHAPDLPLMAINGKYLADALKHAAHDEIDWQLGSTGVFTTLRALAGDTLGVIAPLKLGE